MSEPTLEPGDLLVKQERGELWALTVEGWRRLTIDTAEKPTAERDPIRETHAEQAARIVAAVERADQIRLRLTSPLAQAASELQILAGAVRRTIETAQGLAVGVDDRLVAFAEGIETARTVVLDVERARTA